MFRRFSCNRKTWRTGSGFSGVRQGRRLALLAALAVGYSPCEARDDSANAANASSLHRVLTSTVQFQSLTPNDFLGACDFHLQGVVTLVDTNRELLVLQDATGALALHFKLPENSIEAGKVVSVEGDSCFPYIPGFPNYPYQPSGSEIRDSFEGPTDWGEYYLARMRGYLHPPATGEYTFWIASDNSSELWLSRSDNPTKSKKIAFIPHYSWTNPREWSKLPSQRSESIWLEAGATYYIEAIQEQTTVKDNLAAAWQGPNLPRDVIEGRYLTPWIEKNGGHSPVPTNGILREYWTNYSAGDLSMVSSSRAYESAVSVKHATIEILGQTNLPKAEAINFGQPMSLDKNFRWASVEGTVTFLGLNGEGACLELSDGNAQLLVRVAHCSAAFANSLRHSPLRVEGVCEGGYNQPEQFIPSVLWVPSEKAISRIELSNTNLIATPTAVSLKPVSTNADSAMEGFYGASGVVTFNDRVLGKDCLFVQGDRAAVAVSLKERHYQHHLVVGQSVSMGGMLLPGKYIPTLNPMSFAESGWRPLPEPILQPVQFPVPGIREGRWVEIEGVVRSVNTNGTLSICGKDGMIYLWIGQTPRNSLRAYVDAKLRVRGVLSLTMLDWPLLLIPSRNFVDVQDEAPNDPFAISVSAIGELPPDSGDYSNFRRTRVRGEITYSGKQTIFIQDASGGIRVRTLSENTGAKVGDSVEAVGFPGKNGAVRILTETLLHVTGNGQRIQPKKLDLTETVSDQQNANLIQAAGILLNQKVVGRDQLLELEEHRRIFTATLTDSSVNLPQIISGSRLQLTGVVEEGAAASAAVGYGEKAAGTSLNILLRSPNDLIVLSGPPWWTLKRTVSLVGMLLTVLVVTLLWVYLLRRRLERQQAARLAFSRQVLQGQESERQRIAANLHDGLGQNLLVIKNQARLAMQPVADESVRRDRLNKISEITSQAIEEIRQITHGLRPYQLDRLGLTQAVRAIVNRASENSPVLIASSLDDIDGIFDQESEIHVYRIVQEALNNILKHSAATEAAVVIKNQSAAISLSIRDNGRGFDINTTDFTSTRDPGYGISGIQERIRILGGALVIDSRPAQGTNISIEIPKPATKR